jgi:hypothetical protein
MLSDPPALGPRMRYVDLPPAELNGYIALVLRCATELDELGRRLDRSALPAGLYGPCARGLDEAVDRLAIEARAISTELRSRLYAVRPASGQ